MPTVYKTNKGHALTPNNASQVTISDSLYNFIQAQNQNIVTFETITQTYKPTIPDIPMIDNLRVLPKARNGYNQNITRLNKAKKLLGANDELFKPYTAIKQATEKYQVLDEDTQTNFKGCYWGNLNPENLIDHASAYETYKHWPASSLAYGVSDNATQVFTHLQQALETYLTKDSSYPFFIRGKRLYKFLVTNPNAIYMLGCHPVFNHHDDASGGWRWHKWGPYLGKHTPQCQYLNEEKNIDYVLLWHLYPLKKKGN